MNKLISKQTIRVTASELNNKTLYDKLIPETDWDHSWFEFTKRGDWVSNAAINGWQLSKLDSTHIRFERNTADTAEDDVEFLITIFRGRSTDVKVLWLGGTTLTEGTPQNHDLTSLGGTKGSMFYVPHGWKDSSADGRDVEHCVCIEIASNTNATAKIYNNGGAKSLDSYKFCVVWINGISVQHKTASAITGDSFDVTLDSAVTMSQTRLICSGCYEPTTGYVQNKHLFGQVWLDDTDSVLGSRYDGESLEAEVSIQAISDSALVVDRSLFAMSDGVAFANIALTDRTLARRSLFMVTCASPSEIAQSLAQRRVRQTSHTLSFNSRIQAVARVEPGSADVNRKGSCEAILWPIEGLQDEGFATNVGNTVSVTTTIGSGSGRMLWAAAARRADSTESTAITSILHDGDAPSVTVGDQDGNGGSASNYSSQAVYLWFDADLPAAGDYTLALTCHADVDDCELIWGYLEDTKQAAPSPVDTAENNDADGVYVTTDPAVLTGMSGNQPDVQMNVVPDADSFCLQAFTGRPSSSMGDWTVESDQTYLGHDESNNMGSVWSYVRKTSAASVQLDVLSDDLGIRFGVNDVVALEYLAPVTGVEGVGPLDFAAGIPS